MIWIVYALGLAALGSACFTVWRRESRNRIILAPFFVFCANEALRVWPAAVYARYNGISEDLYPIMVLMSASFAYVLGYMLARDTIGWRVSTPSSFFEAPMRRPSAGAHLFAIAVCTFLLIRLGNYFYEGVPPVISSLKQFSLEGHDSGVASFAAEERLRLTKGHYFGGEYRAQGMIRAVMRVGWPMLTAVAFLLYVQRRTVGWLLLSALLLGGAFAYIAGEGTRGPFAQAMLVLLVILTLAVRIRIRTIAIFGAALLAVLFSLSVVKKFSSFAAEGSVWSDGSQRLAQRIMIDNGLNTVHVVELVRSGQMEMRYGKIHATDLLNALPFVKVGTPFTYELFLILNPYKEGTTFCSMTHLGKIYGDFGWIGCLLAFFFMGLATAVICRFLFSRSKTLLGVVVTGFICVELGNIGITGPLPLIILAPVLAVTAGCYVICLSVGTMYQSHHGGAKRFDSAPSRI
ncbi:MAG: hypothetical protein ACYTG0_43020 [Planctomycetota bacterium]|jgi:hypothetical protein